MPFYSRPTAGVITMKNVLGWTIIVVVALAVFAGCFGGCYAMSRVKVSDGTRDGTIRKISHTGLIFKTWEIEMIGDGILVSKKGGVGPERFVFTAENTAIIAKLRKLPPGQKVRVHYE